MIAVDVVDTNRLRRRRLQRRDDHRAAAGRQSRRCRLARRRLPGRWSPRASPRTSVISGSPEVGDRVPAEMRRPAPLTGSPRRWTRARHRPEQTTGETETSWLISCTPRPVPSRASPTQARPTQARPTRAAGRRTGSCGSGPARSSPAGCTGDQSAQPLPRLEYPQFMRGSPRRAGLGCRRQLLRRPDVQLRAGRARAPAPGGGGGGAGAGGARRLPERARPGDGRPGRATGRDRAACRLGDVRQEWHGRDDHVLHDRQGADLAASGRSPGRAAVPIDRRGALVHAPAERASTTLQ